MKRDTLCVRWNGFEKRWLVTAHNGAVLGGYATRREAVAAGRHQARYHWEVAGPTELVVYRKDGRVSAIKESYGLDPRRHKG